MRAQYLATGAAGMDGSEPCKLCRSLEEVVSARLNRYLVGALVRHADTADRLALSNVRFRRRMHKVVFIPIAEVSHISV